MNKTQLLQGTLNLLILRILNIGPQPRLGDLEPLQQCRRTA